MPVAGGAGVAGDPAGHRVAGVPVTEILAMTVRESGHLQVSAAEPVDRKYAFSSIR